MLTTATQYAEIRGRTKGWVSQQIAAGMPVRKGGGRSGVECQIDTSEAIQWEIDREREKAAPDSQRDRLMRAQAEKFELENQRRRGELVIAEDVAQIFQALAADLNARHEGFAGRFSSEIPSIVDAAIARERILDELRDVRSAFADAAEKLADDIRRSAGNVDDVLEAPVEAQPRPAKKRVKKAHRHARRHK